MELTQRTPFLPCSLPRTSTRSSKRVMLVTGRFWLVLLDPEPSKSLRGVARSVSPAHHAQVRRAASRPRLRPRLRQFMPCRCVARVHGQSSIDPHDARVLRVAVRSRMPVGDSTCVLVVRLFARRNAQSHVLAGATRPHSCPPTVPPRRCGTCTSCVTILLCARMHNGAFNGASGSAVAGCARLLMRPSFSNRDALRQERRDTLEGALRNRIGEMALPAQAARFSPLPGSPHLDDERVAGSRAVGAAVSVLTTAGTSACSVGAGSDMTDGGSSHEQYVSPSSTVSSNVGAQSARLGAGVEHAANATGATDAIRSEEVVIATAEGERAAAECEAGAVVEDATDAVAATHAEDAANQVTDAVGAPVGPDAANEAGVVADAADAAHAEAAAAPDVAAAPNAAAALDAAAAPDAAPDAADAASAEDAAEPIVAANGADIGEAPSTPAAVEQALGQPEQVAATPVAPTEAQDDAAVTADEVAEADAAAAEPCPSDNPGSEPPTADAGLSASSVRGDIGDSAAGVAAPAAPDRAHEAGGAEELRDDDGAAGSDGVGAGSKRAASDSHSAAPQS